MAYPTVFLKKGKERSIDRFHPWIFSGAIDRIDGEPQPGDVVAVRNSKGDFRAVGFLGIRNIKVRILSFKEVSIDAEFWKEEISNAWNLRKDLGLVDDTSTNIFRLLHAEGDNIPGLIVDVYGSVAVFQAHNLGVHKHRQTIAEQIIESSQERIKGVFYKSADTLPKGVENADGWLLQPDVVEEDLLENGFNFSVNFENGQKTGFFIDQRMNRALLGSLAKGKKVLNTFCYTGGFSVYALAGGAIQVDSVDSSQSALDLCAENVSKLGDVGSHSCIQADALKFVKQLDRDYDIVILDPPAFAKHFKARHKATQAYKRLNSTVMKQLKPGAILFTFSCSQVVSTQLFNSTILAAAIESRRSVRILHQLHQPADHPVNVFHPESEYLKGLVLRID